MKSAIGLALLSLSVAALAGCASMEHRAEQRAAASAPAAQTLTAEQLYVARVEQIARRRGINVIWVNAPKFGRQAALTQN